MKFIIGIILALQLSDVVGFSPTSQSVLIPQQSAQGSVSRKNSFRLDASVADITDIEKTKVAVGKLKKVLEREYISFFDPMQREFYADNVSFDDPMTNLAGVDAYQKNVDMLSSRTFLGKFLFQDAGIVLHSVAGGEVSADGSIAEIITRWTLRVTAKVLPWKPTAKFSGVSIYEVNTGGSEGVLVNHQTDYWDSINIQPGGEYAKVDKATAIAEFLNQIKPDNANAVAAGPEVPYELLRRGKDYEMRRYPSYTAATIPYDRRDEGYDVLATMTKGSNPMAPSIMEVQNDNSKKTMSWPLEFAPPGQINPPPVKQSLLNKMEDPMWSDCKIETIPGKIVAIGSFSDASVPPIVRKADRNLREACKRDGIDIPPTSGTSVKFAQYDAIFSMGKRRGEVWIELEDGGHPF